LLDRPAMKPPRDCSLACLLAGLLIGCVHYQNQPLSSARSAATFESRSLNDPELKKFLQQNLKRELAAWPPKEWDFPSLTFAAFYYHPSLDVARAQWGVAKAGVQTAGGRPNPTVGLTPEYT